MSIAKCNFFYYFFLFLLHFAIIYVIMLIKKAGEYMENRNILIGKRIKQRREELGLTQEDLGNRLWLNKSTIQRYESGKIAKIKLPVIHAIAKQVDVDPNWLVLKTDEMGSFNWKYEWYNNEEPVQQFDNIRPVKLKRFPMLGEIACGEPLFADEDREHYIMADMDIKADFCLTAKGDSMINARINDGDVVFISQTDMVENGEIAAVIIEDEATLKRVYYDRENNILQLVAENPRYKPLIYRDAQLDQVHILGKAVYFMSAL